MSMTWNDFKKLVDERLKDQGNDGDVELYYIDVSYGDLNRFDGIEIVIDVVMDRLSIF